MAGPSISLDPFQSGAIDATYDFLEKRTDNPCVVSPVGSGKSVIIAGLSQDVLTRFPGRRICVLAHARELVRQNAEKLARIWPGAPLGIYSASLNRRDRFEPIIFASIQSVWNRAATLGRFDLLLVDEAHRIPIKTEGTYRHFIAECKKFNKDIRVVGFTATPYRLGGGPVCDPENILNAVSFEARIGDLIAAGYLTPLVSKGAVARADLTGVHVRSGEYVERELSAAMTRGNLVQRACREIVELCANRRAWIIFASSVDHANAIHAELSSLGVSGRVVVGNTPSGERAESIAAFSRGAFRFLVTVDVLAEGYDEPRIDAVIMLRPTKSAGKYVQEVGRGTRLIDPAIRTLPSAEERRAAIAASVKPNCLVLDFAGNIAEHGPVDAIEVEPARKRGAKATLKKQPVKECPICHSFVAIPVMTCACGYEWPRAPAKHDGEATDAPILSTESPLVCEHKVTAVSYGKYIKDSDSPPCLKVVYSCGMREFPEWVHIERAGPLRATAVQWWNARNYTRTLCVPRTVDEALEVAHQLRTPVAITVNEAGKFARIVGVRL